MSDSLPSISVVVPSLNQGRFIRETLESILEQDHPAQEIIVVDGVSCDGTLEVLQDFTERVKWTSEPDTGQSNAINKGLDAATGDVLCWLNSDDLLEPGALRAISHFFSMHPRAQSAFGRCRIVDQDGKPARPLVGMYKTWWARLANGPASLKILNYIPQPATFWRRSAMGRIGRLDEALNYAMDYDLWLRLARLGPVHFMDQCLAAFRVHKDSKSLRGTRAQLAEAYDVAKRHGANRFECALHAAHDVATLLTYDVLYGKAAHTSGEKTKTIKNN